MCLVLFAYNYVPGYRLVLAANRDEFNNRPTAPLGYLPGGEQVLAGQDLRGGGTWLGLGRTGKLAALTNYRDPGRLNPSAPTRGGIVKKYLESDMSAQSFLQEFAAEADRYSGFNLLLADDRELYHFSSVTGKSVKLAPGVYGLANHLLDTPWPKVVRGKQLFAAILNSRSGVDSERLLKMLEDRDYPPAELLPDTGVGPVWERMLSPMFILGQKYGTRSSAVITMRDDGETIFIERTFTSISEVREAGRKSFII
jgi:uncharacterized protein with NRDE domain